MSLHRCEYIYIYISNNRYAGIRKLNSLEASQGCATRLEKEVVLTVGLEVSPRGAAAVPCIGRSEFVSGLLLLHIAILKE